MSSRDRALSIIELLARHTNGLPLSEIADQLMIPRSATHRLLAELRDDGYIRQEHDGGIYRLTVKLAALGLSYLGGVGVHSLVQPILDQLAEKTADFVMLCVIESGRLMRVSRAQGARGGLVYTPNDVAEVYLSATSNGHAWLSCLSDETALELVARQGFNREGFGPNAPRTLEDLLRHIREARAKGYALIFDGYQDGTSAIAAPVRRLGTGTPIGTISIGGPSVRMTRTHMEAMAPDLLSSAEQMAAAATVSPLFGSEERLLPSPPIGDPT